MARTVRITKVDRRSDRVILSFRSGGEKFCFEVQGGPRDFRSWIAERVSESAEQVAFMGLAHWLAKHRGNNDFSEIDGTSFTIDLEAGTLTSAKGNG